MRRHLSLLVAVAVGWAAMATAWAAGDPERPKQWNLDRIGHGAALGVANGSGVVVAVVDSGVDLRHEDLAGRLVGGYDFVDDDAVPQDQNGHGTHVAGIVAAARGNGRGISGVAPGAKIMPIRVLDADGSGGLDDVVAGIRFAVRHGADVVNLSLGDDVQAILGPGFSEAIDEAWRAGVIVVVAAGNQFLTPSGFGDEPAVVVAATDRNDAKPTYSSRVGDARWGVAAPGGEIPDLGAEDAILSTYWRSDRADTYAYQAGTSQAAPHVAGALALLLSTRRFSPEQAIRRLLDTAHDVGAAGPDTTFGAGRIDLAAAFKGLAPAGGGTRPPASSAPGTTRTPAPAPTTTPPTPAPAVAGPAGAPTTTVAGAPPGPAGWRQDTALDPTPIDRDVALPAAEDAGGDRDIGTPATIAALLLGAVATGARATWRRDRVPAA